MLKFASQCLEEVARRRHQRRALRAWSLLMGRQAASLWLEALSRRDASRLSNA